ncbi:MAG: tetratricopeptide repeat protein, partial [Gemmatimonadaceae bacterium]
MSNTAKLKKKATELEQKKQFDKALQLYVQLLDEAGRDLDDADLQLYNRVGDLLMRQGNTTEALSYYEKAVDVYAERGFLNNAIALCSKILRQSPARTAVYYKLGKISANKGFKSDAKKNFLEYADRMEKAGQRNEAFRALKEFADLCPDQDDIRLMLAEMLSKDNRKDEALDQLQTLYERLEGEGRGAEARATVDRMKAIDPAVEPRSSGTYRAQKSNDLVFLDLTNSLAERPPASALPLELLPPSDSPKPKRLTMPGIPAVEGLTFTFVPDDDDEASDDFALVESIEGLVPSVDESYPLDAAAIEALLTMPDAAVSTHEREVAEYAQEDQIPLADLQTNTVPESEPADFLLEPPVELTGWEPTVPDAKHAFATPPGAPVIEPEPTGGGPTVADAEHVDMPSQVPLSDTPELTGWEPTFADAKHLFATPLMAPLIDEPILSGSEFAELALRDMGDVRLTSVHDLLLPTELPRLSPPGGVAAPPTQDMPSNEHELNGVDSPSPIDLSDPVVEEAPFDLVSELTSPFSRENARDAARLEATAQAAMYPSGIEFAVIEIAQTEAVSPSVHASDTETTTEGPKEARDHGVADEPDEAVGKPEQGGEAEPSMHDVTSLSNAELEVVGEISVASEETETMELLDGHDDVSATQPDETRTVE